MPTNNVLAQRMVEQRRVTSGLLDCEGQMISLFRPSGGQTVSDQAGSRRKSATPDAPLGPKLRALFGLTMEGRGVNQMPERWFTTSLGQREKVVKVLIGSWNDDIQKGDYFLDEHGNRNEVVYVHDDRSFQTKAECVVITDGQGA